MISFRQFVENTEFKMEDPEQTIYQKHFDALPKVVSEQELEAAIQQQGALECWRAFESPQFAEAFKSGKYYIGTTQNPMYRATGIYCAYGTKGQKYAKDFFKTGGAVLHMAVKPEAKLIDSEQLNKMARDKGDEADEELKRERYEKQRETWNLPMSQQMSAKNQIERELDKKRQVIIKTFNDIGYACVHFGYDGVDVKFAEHILMLNRGMMLVAE